MKDFADEFEMSFSDKPAVFEALVNYSVLSRMHSGTLNINDVIVDGTDDTGIDGLAIIVNEHIVKSKQEIDDYVRALGRLDAQFVFIQSKLSNKFEMGEISKFLYGVEDFFRAEPTIRINDGIQHARNLEEHVFSAGLKIRRNPVCQMYYATTGKWVGDATLQGLIDTTLDRLKQTGLFSDVVFIPVDLEKVKTMFLSLRNRIERQVNFSNRTDLPLIEGVQEAYIGILPTTEYFKLICDDDGILQRNLFYDNVRDFQGDNPVNLEVAETINNESTRDKFVLLNNGITIVAKSIPNKRASLFTIADYQIVNGCQTSHILYFNKDKLSENTYIPIKLIVTDNQEVTNNIIKATNRQTEVKLEAFEALSPFHKRLETFFATFDKEKDQRLYYERRSKQYDNQQIKKKHIVTLPSQINTFVAMFLDEPHSINRYYGELLKAYRDRLFQEYHAEYPYYISSYSAYMLELFFKANTPLQKYYKFRFHMLLLFKNVVVGSKVSLSQGKETQKYCDKLCEVLWDKTRCFDIFNSLVTILEEGLKLSEYSPDESASRKNFTNTIATLAVKGVPSKEDTPPNLIEGAVDWFDERKGFGFIKDAAGNSYFVHYSFIAGSGFKTLESGQKVSFTPVKGAKGLQAENVNIA